LTERQESGIPLGGVVLKALDPLLEIIDPHLSPGPRTPEREGDRNDRRDEGVLVAEGFHEQFLHSS
jgi:hypothetical protein